MLNHIVLMGRLTKDPELKHTQNGTAVTSFTIAVARDHNREQCDFVDIVAWRNAAEIVSKYFTKGRMIVVSGQLQSRKWTDKDGNKRISWEVVAGSVYFGDSKKESSGAVNVSADDFDDDNFGDEDLPF